MGNAQRVGSVGINGAAVQLGVLLSKQIKSIFYTQQSTAAMADSIACGNATPKPHNEVSSQYYGQRPNVLVWSEV